VSSELPDLPLSSSSRWILSLAGGGYKGLFTAHFLSLLQTELGRPLHEVFDLVAGTSIGSILALGIALSLDAPVLEELLVSKGKTIFPGYRRLLPMPIKRPGTYLSRFSGRLHDVGENRRGASTSLISLH
jgi:patatin-like phospholipase/acyl hydrolase